MIIRKISLTNFRCFSALPQLELDERLNVFIGGNGAGKSALLDAIALGLGPILSRLPELSAPGLKRSDIRLTASDIQAPFTRVALSAGSRSDGGNGSASTVEWDRLYSRDKSPRTKRSLPKDARGLKQLHEWVDSIIERHNAKQPYRLPVFAHYGTNRAVDVPHHRLRETRRRRAFERLDALNGALNPNADFRRAVAWFELLEGQELRRKEESRSRTAPPLLGAVRQAIERMLPGLSKPRIDADTLRFVVDGRNSEGKRVQLFLDQLSDGYQVMLGVVLDFALRLVRANPPTPESPDPLAAEAIMIIDEVDLHLHPSWQQRVIPDLLRTFPGAQLIVTTHSPQVVTTVRKKNVRCLKDFQAVEAPTEIIGAESGRVLEETFEVPVRPQELEEVKLLERYIEATEALESDPTEVGRLREKVRQTFSDDEPAIELTDMTLEQRSILGNLNLTLPPIPAPTDEEE